MDKEDMAEAHIVGQITTDVEVKKSASGISWLSFTVESVCGQYKKYNKFSAFKETADKLAANVRKGKRVMILASVSYTKNKKTDQWGTNLTVESFKVLDDREVKVKEAVEQPKPQPEKAEVPQDNDLPF